MSSASKPDFNNYVRDVLELLVSSCPLAVDINVETFNLPKGEYERGSSSKTFSGLPGSYKQTQEEEMLKSTLSWLDAEGLIRIDKRGRYVATLQALKVYGAVPNALAE